MGLCLSVGYTADLKDNDTEGYQDFKAILIRVNQALSAEGLRPHVEPEAVKQEDSVSFDMYGYSGLHYLPRIAAHVNYSGELPAPGKQESSEDKLLKWYCSESVS